MTPKEVVGEFVARCNTACGGGSADPYAMLTEDVRVHLPGKTIISGEYPNKEIVENVLVAAVAERVEQANFELAQIVAQGDRVATLLVTTGKTIDGEVYNPEGQPGGCIFGVEGDQIREITLFPDDTLVETVILGRRYVRPARRKETRNG